MTVSLVLTVNVSKADVNDYVKDTTDPRGECKALSTLFSSLASGAISGSVIVQKSSAASVSASGTVTLTYASTANNDTVTIAGVTLTCVTGTPSGYTQFKKETDATKTASNMVTAINNLTTLNKYVRATSALGVVTVSANQAGVVGNLITLATSNGTGFAVSAAALAGGTGGAVEAQTTYSRGL